MRVLYFHQYFSTRQGAGGTRSYEMARRLVARGHQVLVVCGGTERSNSGLAAAFSNGSRRGFVEGIEVLEFEIAYTNSMGLLRRTGAFLRFAVRSLWIALTEQYDLIFATTTPLTVGIPGIAARWGRGKPFVLEVRDLWPELPRALGMHNPLLLWGMSLLELISYRSATRLIGLAPGIVEGIARRGIPRSRIGLIPNGCDLDLFSGSEQRWRPHGVAASDLLAVFSGSHGVANGLDSVLGAGEELQRRGRTDIKILLIGEGKLKMELQARVMASGLSTVIFHDPVSKTRLAGLLAASDIGLQVLANIPAFYDGTSPNKFFDYLSAGLPVLINYPGWLATLVDESQCGYVVPPLNPVAFADSLEHALANRKALATMGARSLELARDRFDREVLGERFIAWLEGTCL